jgi:methyl-accepting chemotaxis protein
MRISTKLIAITLGSSVLVGGLVLSLVVELKSLSTGYTHILQGPVLQATQAREAQVDFKVQGQDWKDILLQGQNPEDLAKYTAQFHAQQAKVKAEVGTLAAAADDPNTKALLSDFLVADDALNQKYDVAYGMYLKRGFDFKAADTLVRGEDLAPDAIFDYVVAQLNSQAVTAAGAEKARTLHQLLILLVIVGGLLLVDTVVYCSVLFGVIKRLSQLKTVSDRLAVADIEGLSIDISGHDEIGAIGDSLKGVEAALHELLAVHAH